MATEPINGNLHVFEHWTELHAAGHRSAKAFLWPFSLKEEDNGWGAELRVQMVVRHPGNRFSRRSAAEWPLPGTQWIEFYLDHSDCSLRSEPCGDVVPLSFEALSDGVTFVTPPLTEELHINGPSAAKALRVILDRGRRPVPNPPAVQSRF